MESQLAREEKYVASTDLRDFLVDAYKVYMKNVFKQNK